MGWCSECHLESGIANHTEEWCSESHMEGWCKERCGVKNPT